MENARSPCCRGSGAASPKPASACRSPPWAARFLFTKYSLGLSLFSFRIQAVEVEAVVSGGMDLVRKLKAASRKRKPRERVTREEYWRRRRERLEQKAELDKELLKIARELTGNSELAVLDQETRERARNVRKTRAHRARKKAAAAAALVGCEPSAPLLEGIAIPPPKTRDSEADYERLVAWARTNGPRQRKLRDEQKLQDICRTRALFLELFEQFDGAPPRAEFARKLNAMAFCRGRGRVWSNDQARRRIRLHQALEQPGGPWHIPKEHAMEEPRAMDVAEAASAMPSPSETAKRPISPRKRALSMEEELYERKLLRMATTGGFLVSEEEHQIRLAERKAICVGPSHEEIIAREMKELDAQLADLMAFASGLPD